MQKKLLVGAGVVLTLLLALNLFGDRSDKARELRLAPAGQDEKVVSASVLYALPTPTPDLNNRSTPESKPSARPPARFPAIHQRDRSQYLDETEWRTWAPSACSAAVLASVINGYGQSLRVTDVLSYLQQQNAIKASAGLFRYNVFADFAGKYGLKTIYSEDKNLDGHFNRVLDYLKQGYPVILNVLDATYFPGGHFIVGTGFNPDGTVAILNPDPVKNSSVNQNWPVEGLKLYFSRVKRSAAILPG